MTSSLFGQKFSKPLNAKVEPANLSEKSRVELIDLLYREEKLCKNTKFLEKLPDKGAKILKFYEKVKTELQRRDNHDKLCGELAKLTIDDSTNALDRLEWTGNYTADMKDLSVEEDDTNLFRILATHSGTEVSKRKNIKCEPQVEVQPLPAVDAYAKELCQRFDLNAELSTKKKFYTHKPLNKISVTESAKDKHTVSPSNSSSDNSTSKVKMLSLQESIVAQHQQNKILKEIEFRSAIKKLHSRIDFECQNPQIAYYDYREHSNVESDDEVSSNVTSREVSEHEDEL